MPCTFQGDKKIWFGRVVTGLLPDELPLGLRLGCEVPEGVR